mmetsp:Transcript_142/g.518  ORF Transcript_142/g.518 Transcript_142/m.518 type:complete len:204 (-) Transcript_142:600-1211(-)
MEVGTPGLCPLFATSGFVPLDSGRRRSSIGPIPCGRNPRKEFTPPRKNLSVMQLGRVPDLSPSGARRPILPANIRSEVSLVGSLTIPASTCLANPTAPPIGATPICVSDLMPSWMLSSSGTPGSSTMYCSLHTYLTLPRSRWPICCLTCGDAMQDRSAISCHPPSSENLCCPSELVTVKAPPRKVSVKELCRCSFVTAWKIRT